MDRINLIITTYAGKYNNEVKNNYLKDNLRIINSLKTDITTITIMKPKIDEEHEIISGYYDFTNINIENIKNKIVIYECDNIGISYGQFFKALEYDNTYDYYIFIEDDYTPFINYFEQEFIKEYKKINDLNSLLCSFIFKNRKWDIINYAYCINEDKSNIDILKNKLDQYELSNIKCNIPDFSLCIISRHTIKKLLDKFNTFTNILDLFNIKFKKIWLHQILFGYVIHSSGINIYDTSNTYLNIFYNTVNQKLSICNYEHHIQNWDLKIEKHFELPLFIPIQIINLSRYINDFNGIKKFFTDENVFIEKMYLLSNICTIIIRNIEYDDYDKGYIDLMFEFTNYYHKISKEDFKKYLDNKNIKIIVIYSQYENRIIGSGTIFKLEKLHNNPIGLIEDVIITKNYRGLNYGKLLIQKLIDIGKKEFKCYKVILNCLEHNIGFYEKCGFKKIGYEMKIL